MKKVFISLFIVLGWLLINAQEAPNEARDTQKTGQTSTLLKEPVRHGIYGSAVMKYATVGTDQTNSLLIGGEVCWVLNKKYQLGLGFTGLSTIVDAPQVFPVEDLVLVTNYGGIIFGYHHNPHKLIHFEAQSLFGIGQAFYRDRDYRATYNQNDAYILIEPTVSAVLNVTTGFRLGAGFSYRLAQRVNLIGLENSDLAGLSLNLSFRIGRF